MAADNAQQQNSNPPPSTDRRSNEGGGFDINRVVSSMIGREKGNAKAVIRHLVREGRRYRNKLRQTEVELSKRPPELKQGEVILSVEDAKRWNALKDIELTPEQVKESLKKKTELEAQETARTHAALVEKAGQDLGVKRLKLLAEEVGRRNMDVSDREVEQVVEGKRTKVMQVHVRPKGDDKAPWVSFQEYYEKDLKELQPALLADEEPEGESSADRGKEQATVTFPAQRGARGRAPAKDAVVKVIGDKYLSPAELKKQQST